MVDSKQKEIQHLNKLLKRRLKRHYTGGNSVYIVKHPSIDGKYKLGSTKNMNDRLTGYAIGSPDKYEVVHHRLIADMELVEKIVQCVLDKYRCQDDCQGSKKREWFDIDLDVLIKETDSVCDFLESHRQIYEPDYGKLPEIKQDVIIDRQENKTHKVCFTCKISKPLNEFYGRDENKDGKEGRCKECFLIKQKEYREAIQPPDNTVAKKCRKCCQLLSIDNFKPVPRSKDGYSYICNNCKNPIKFDEPKIDKKCSFCKVLKPLHDFNNCSTSVDGKFSYCRSCSSIKSKQSREKRKQNGSNIQITSKVCAECKTEKQVEQFWKNCESKDGYGSYCMVCAKKLKHIRNKIITDEVGEEIDDIGETDVIIQEQV